MKPENKPDISTLHPVLLKPEDILDQAVYENTWLPIGDNKQMDLHHLIEQGRIGKP